MSTNTNRMGITLETSGEATEFGDGGGCRGLVSGSATVNPVGVQGCPEGDGVRDRMPGGGFREGGLDFGSAGGAGTSRRRGTRDGRRADAGSSSEGD